MDTLRPWGCVVTVICIPAFMLYITWCIAPHTHLQRAEQQCIIPLNETSTQTTRVNHTQLRQLLYRDNGQHQLANDLAHSAHILEQNTGAACLGTGLTNSNKHFFLLRATPDTISISYPNGVVLHGGQRPQVNHLVTNEKNHTSPRDLRHLVGDFLAIFNPTILTCANLYLPVRVCGDPRCLGGSSCYELNASTSCVMRYDTYIDDGVVRVDATVFGVAAFCVQHYTMVYERTRRGR